MDSNYCILFSGIQLTGGAKQNMPSISKLLKIAEEENKVTIYENYYKRYVDMMFLFKCFLHAY